MEGHDRSPSVAAQFNQEVDNLTWLHKINIVSDDLEWERLLKWLHVK